MGDRSISSVIAASALVLFCAGGCGDDGSAADQDGVAQNNGANMGSATENNGASTGNATGDPTGGSNNVTPELEFPGLVPTPTTGAYWDIATYETGFGSTDFMGYRLELGAPVTIDGIKGFEVTITKLWDDNDGGQLPTLYRYLSFEDHAIRRNRGDGSGWHMTLSEYGSFEGTLFFSIFNDDSALTLTKSALKGTFVSNPDAFAISQSESRDCEYYPEIGQTLCEDGEPSGAEFALGVGYYAAGIGFLGHHQHNCIPEGCLTTEAAVVRHSLTGPAPACGPTAADPKGAQCCRELLGASMYCPTAMGAGAN